MLKLEGAVMSALVEFEDLQVLLGSLDNLQNFKPRKSFNYDSIDFLTVLSEKILTNPQTKRFPDLAAFAFAFRRSILEKLQNDLTYENCFGTGTAFHIAPSNVPINFAYSFSYSLLAGNSNVIRIPSRDFPQITLLLSILNALLEESRFASIKSNTIFIKYPHNEVITSFFSNICDLRVIWGGNFSIQNIRKSPIKIHAKEVVFFNRISICLINAKALIELDQENLLKLANNFFNDAYLFDQRGCSSPKIIFWTGREYEIKLAKSTFWSTLENVIREKYDFPTIKALDKLMSLCENIISNPNPQKIIHQTNLIYRLSVDPEICSMNELINGTFSEISINSPSEIGAHATHEFQTLTYFGFDKSQLMEVFERQHPYGIARVVPVGQAFDMSHLWDGYNLISEFSKRIDFR